MQMHVIATELGDDWTGPFADLDHARKILAIIQQIDPDAEIISRETDPYRDQIEAGLLPYKIHVDIIGGEPQLPPTVGLTWPPMDTEGIVTGDPDHTEYFVWAKNERDAILRIARLNRATSSARAEA